MSRLRAPEIAGSCARSSGQPPRLYQKGRITRSRHWPILYGARGAQLTEVFQDSDFQITGVAVSKTGRMFVNYPRWSNHYLDAVVEVYKNGSVKPYPDEAWNRWQAVRLRAERSRRMTPTHYGFLTLLLPFWTPSSAADPS